MTLKGIKNGRKKFTTRKWHKPLSRGEKKENLLREKKEAKEIGQIIKEVELQNEVKNMPTDELVKYLEIYLEELRGREK